MLSISQLTETDLPQNRNEAEIVTMEAKLGTGLQMATMLVCRDLTIT